MAWVELSLLGATRVPRPLAEGRAGSL